MSSYAYGHARQNAYGICIALYSIRSTVPSSPAYARTATLVASHVSCTAVKTGTRSSCAKRLRHHAGLEREPVDS